MRKLLSGSSTYGKLVLLIGFIVAIPIAVIPFYPEELPYLTSFLAPSAASALIGFTVCRFVPRRERPVTEWQSPLQRGSLPVMFAWSYAFLMGAAPFMISGRMGFILSLFESVSGWTTTGLTVVDVSVIPKVFLFHRALMQYCGGMGLIIMIAMLVRSKQNMNLYSAEGHTDRLMPSVIRTARIIFLLFGCFLMAGTVAYALCGMEVFDAVCHTMSALSTAGFTTKPESIGHYGSVAIELITVALMLIGATNFATLLLMTQLKLRKAFRVSEVRFMLVLLAVTVPVVGLTLMGANGLAFGRGMLESLFGIVSTFTTTGYSTMYYAQWPPFAVGILVLLMVVGGSAGSTAGGIKLLRLHLLIRITRDNVINRLAPARRVATPVYYRAQGKTPIDNSLIKDTIGFVSCYIGILIVGSLILTLTAGCSLDDAVFEFTSAFGTVGISNGLTNAGASAGTLLVLMVGMVLGRLEIFIVFIGIYAGAHLIKKRIYKPGDEA